MSTAEVAKRYFGALAARNVDSAVAGWSPGGIDRVAGPVTGDVAGAPARAPEG